MDVVDRLTVRTIDPDPRARDLLADAHALGVSTLTAIDVADVYFVDAGSGGLTADHKARLETVIVDPLLQRGEWGQPAPPAGAHAVESALLPGVTDAAAEQVLRASRALELPVLRAATGRRFELRGTLSPGQRDLLVNRLLANAVIERVADTAIAASFGEAATPIPAAIVPVRGLDDTELAQLNRDRGMALDPAELRAIAEWFRSEGRDPTDVELETLAQTWSEHCAHKTFRARITLDGGGSIEPLLAQLRRATEALAAPFVRSAFVGNAGIVSFVPGTTVAIKAETHNHPSAIEPFGGANTGVGGVIRDVMGAGHHPIATTDVLCFGPTDLPVDRLPSGVLHPRRIAQGVVAGVADYGNKIGLPTVAGAVLYDEGFTANPLVFCGCIGVAHGAQARSVTTSDRPQPGDLVVVLGGRTGRDGLRGATFSSATMDATTGDVAGASVQIGDPITEKLLIDLLADAHGALDRPYSAITDCGAGGLSSAIGEMAEGVGADVDVRLAPLKYAGLSPWEVWLSEAQERMVVAVQPDRLERWQQLADRRGVELTVLGRFTGDGVLRVRDGEAVVLELSTEFLHDGRPQRTMRAELPSPVNDDAVPVVTDPAAALLALLAHPNIASKEAIVRRYDHEIRGATVVRPLVGAERDAPADGVVLAEPSDRHGLAIGVGVNPWYGITDPWRMAHAVVDEAIRNVVAVGADPDAVALMDNFSWGDPRRPSTLGELAEAVRGCCEASLANSSPFVSGKDSLNNEYLGSDGERHSVPPTLVITAVGHLPDASASITPDLKADGDLIVMVGRTLPELGGSHLAKVAGDAATGTGSVPAPDPQAPQRYRRLHAALRSGRVRACHDVSEGGLAVALAEMAIGGRLGVRAVSDPSGAVVHADGVVALFAESTGRLLCEIAPGDLAWFRDTMGGDATVVAEVTAEPVVMLGALMPPGFPPVTVALDEAVAAFTGSAR